MAEMTEQQLATIYNAPSSLPKPEPARPPDPAEVAAAKRYPTMPGAQEILRRAEQEASTTQQRPAPQPKPAQAQPKVDDSSGAAGAPATRETTPPTEPGEYAFSVPQGIEIDHATAREFSTIADEIGLDAETQQRLVDLQARAMQQQEAVTRKTHAQWRAEAQRLGSETLSDAREIFGAFATPEVEQLVNHFRLGDNPHFLKMLAEIRRFVRDQRS